MDKATKELKIKERAIQELLGTKIRSKADLMVAKRKIAKKYSIKILCNSDILKVYQEEILAGRMKARPELIRILRKRAIRTMSGIAPVAVLTKPYPCPGKCAYCPTEKNVPQSYLSNEPAVMRAIRCHYHPYKQVQQRLRALEANGHQPTKIELIVIGGTWSALPKKYKYWYITSCFAGANNYNAKYKMQNTKLNLKCRISEIKKRLLIEQKRNEKAKYKIIGLTLETRPDYINDKELIEMRELGCTRVEIGVQAIDDKILKLNRRGHGVAEIVQATKLLKDYGFKVTYHLMPGLPGSTPARDLKMFEQLFSDERFQPDQIKFYPTVVTGGSLLYRWWKQGKYKPYSDKTLRKLIVDCKKHVPEYVRIIRLIRDIPKESIIAGNMITNLRQVMQDYGAQCKCIRCREARDKKFKIQNSKFKIIKYRASGGEEYFLQYIDKTGKVLYGFCRLRLTKEVGPLTKGSDPLNLEVALIRELHVYGELVPIGTSAGSTQAKKVQHTGLGKKLMKEAEKIAKENEFKRIAVISGVGVRDYYRKLGYKLKDSYMVKNI